MRNYDCFLMGDLGNWTVYAMTSLNMTENEATLLWNNHHNIGKYLICEARENSSTRLFIRNVTNQLVDAYKKEGWWNTFTVTQNPTSKGLWLAKAVEYRLDRNGYMNLEVETILPVDNIKFRKLFSFESDDGTWNSPAWWLMMVKSDAFLGEYDFRHRGFLHNPNIEALIDNFPQLQNLSHQEIGLEMLHEYLSGSVTMEEIEECLNKPTDWERLVTDIIHAVRRGTVSELYGEKYPIFASKVENNVKNGSLPFAIDNAEDYLKRQMRSYDKLVKEGKIEPVEGDVLDIVEAALAYTKSLKDAEKAAKKAKRKAMKVAKTE